MFNIKSLASQNYNIRNVFTDNSVGTAKQPCAVVKGTHEHIAIAFKDKTNEYFKNALVIDDSCGYGLKCGRQMNGKYIICLDFDIYIKSTGLDCKACLKALSRYDDICGGEAGLYQSSTEGNCNVLLDITDCAELIVRCESAPESFHPFQNNGFEIQVTKHQVIPPTSTPCKKTNQMGERRKFSDDTNPFKIVSVGDNVYNYLDLCFNTQAAQRTIRVVSPTSSDNEQLPADPKYIDMILNGIGNKLTMNQYLRLASVLKSNGYSFAVWDKWCVDVYGATDDHHENLWNDCLTSNDQNMSFVEALCKQYNPAYYAEFCKNRTDGQKLDKTAIALMCAEMKAAQKATEKCAKDEQKATEYKIKCEEKIINNKRVKEEKSQAIKDVMLKHISEGWVYCYDDNSAIDILVGRMELVFKFSNRVIFYKNNNQWICDDEYRIVLMKTFILEAKICTSAENRPFIQYSSGVGKMKLLLDGLTAKLCIIHNDEKFQSKIHSSTQNKMCFKDGVLDFQKKTFTLWNDVPANTIFTTIIIDREFATYFASPNKAFVKKIKDDIFEKVFGLKTELVLKFLSRGIASCIEDKNFMSYAGNRNCGKGIIYQLLSFAFGQYVCSFDLRNMLCCREGKESSDSAKENMWLIPLEFVRIAITQETEENENENIKAGSKISNRMMKSVVSGGDTITARQLFKNPRDFNIDATLVFMGNNELAISGEDSAQHHLKCNGVRQFITKEQYDAKTLLYDAEYMSSYAIRSETLKADVKTDEYANAMVYLLYVNYTDKAINIHHVFDEDDAVELSVRDLIFKHFRVTKNDKDRVSCDELYELISKDKKKIKAELKELGCVGGNDCKISVSQQDESGNVSKTQVRAFKCLALRQQAIDDESQ